MSAPNICWWHEIFIEITHGRLDIVVKFANFRLCFHMVRPTYLIEDVLSFEIPVVWEAIDSDGGIHLDAEMIGRLPVFLQDIVRCLPIIIDLKAILHAVVHFVLRDS